MSSEEPTQLGKGRFAVPTSSLDEIQQWIDTHDSVFVGTGHPEQIESAEEELGVPIPPTFRAYLSRWGLLSVRDLEYLGLTESDDFSELSYPNFVSYTIEKRRAVGLPRELIVVRDDNGHRYVCVDTGRALDDSEFPITIWDPISRARVEETSLDFAEFVLAELEELDEVFG